MSTNKILFTITYSLVVTICLTHICWQDSDALTCYCNGCDNSTKCVTTDHKDSRCYKKVEIESISDNQQGFVVDYGCLSGSDGSLTSFQCQTNMRGFETPTFMRCCSDSDNCNANLPDPTKADDPRFEIDERQTSQDQTLLTTTFIVWSMVALVLAAIVVALCLIRGHKKPMTSKDSICSLKESYPNFTSSSSSSNSCSISDYLSQKPDPMSTQEASCITADLTSGVGERMLNQRTMARAVGFGPTDHVGNGRFGRVFRGQFHGEDVAVKAFRSIDHLSWQREDTIFRTLNHENIVRFIASEVTTTADSSTEMWMFLEYCPCGSLCDYLDENDILGPQQALKILFSIINGLNYLHEDFSQGMSRYKPSIAHRDIKSKNILMRSPEACCIADFGHALIKIDEKRLDYGNYQHLQVGTIRYMAPEILQPDPRWNLDFTQFSTFAQADLYQYGLILWEVCHRTAIDVLHPAGEHKLPYDEQVPQNPSIQDMIQIVCHERYRPQMHEKWERYPTMKRLAELMVECWRPNPKSRMETLGVKKKVKELLDQYFTPPRRLPYLNVSLSHNSSRERNEQGFSRDQMRSIA